jgi:acyl-coenzyme A synthetase/AMP-(fatty) acid ligase
MHTLPLLLHDSPAAVVAYRRDRPIDARQFLHDAARTAAHLPAARHVLNACTDRYHFAVGFAACLMSGRVTLLPPTLAPEVLREIANLAPDAICLTDTADCTLDLPRVLIGEVIGAEETPPLRRAELCVPQIPPAQLAAILFTSGSTGTPLPHRKSWGMLVRSIREGASRLGLLDGRARTLIGTVPPQHMYGLENTVMLALQTGNALVAEHPFYPADICAVIAAAPRPRVLISTPVHLRTLLAGGGALPPLDLIVCATAPLTQELARAAEDKFATQLLEIYGSTETGQIATRRTAVAVAWRLHSGVQLKAVDGDTVAHGGHVEQDTVLNDKVETLNAGEFLLHGRSADMVNIAGKRSSFGYLNAQLAALPGVIDGVFYLRDGGNGKSGAGEVTNVPRLAAFVVAPGQSAAALLEKLRQRIDPVFLPRPLLLVERLPRNAVGKLPRAALETLLTEIRIPADHASFAGHFPGRPILPGAVLLDEALHRIETSLDLDLTRWQIDAVKFLGAVGPGDTLVLEHSAPAGARIQFNIRSLDRTVLKGTLSSTSEPS